MKNQLLGLEMMWLEAECSRYDSFYDVISQTQPDIGLIALDSDPEKALALVAKIIGDHGGIVEFANLPTKGTNFRVHLPIHQRTASSVKL